MNLRLLVKYLSDECSKDEKEYVERWTESDPRNKEFLDSLERIWEVKLNDEFEVNAEEAWYTFKKDVLSDERDSITAGLNSSSAASGKFNTKYIFWHVAAAAALILFVFLFFSKVDLDNGEEKKQFTMREIITEKGEKSRIRLSDGTNIILNADSRIQIPSQFVGNSREVHLRGEAHFEVTKQNGKPFIVRTAYSFTKVLGTKFVVSAYSKDKVVVAVEEGKVQIGSKYNKEAVSDGDKNIATGGYVGVLHEGKGPIINKVEDIGQYTSWAEGKLVFKSTPLRDIVPKLERWYDIEIRVNDPELYDRQLTANFQDESLAEVLKVTALSMNMKYSREKDAVIFLNDIK